MTGVCPPPGSYAPILPDLTEVLMQPDRSPDPEQAALLLGVAVCGFCEKPVGTETRGVGQVAYRCAADGPRDHVLRSAPPVDSWVRLMVLEHLDRSGLLRRPVHHQRVAAELDTPAHLTHELPGSLTGAGPLEVAWDRLGAERQRAVLRRLTDRIALHPVPPGRRPGDPDVLRATVAVAWVRR